MGAAQQIEGVGINVTVDAAIPQYTLVVLGAPGADGYPTASPATAADGTPVYQLTRRSDASGDQLTAIGMHRQETFIAIANEALTAGSLAQIGGAGRVAAGGTQFQVIKGASGAGKYCEIAPNIVPA